MILRIKNSLRLPSLQGEGLGVRSFLLLLFTFVLLTQLHAQKFTLNGYVKDMQTFYFIENGMPMTSGEVLDATNYNMIHNRLNFTYNPNAHLRFELGVRNRLLAGKLMAQLPQYASYFKQDDGIVQLSWNLAEKNGWFLNTSIDRLYVDYTLGKWQFKVGRQRINWGIDLVWNPNDLFNAFSYIDFDYEERPGSDAVSLTYYTSESSSLDLAFKTDKNNKTTAAARYRFNYHDYDIQLIGGKSEADVVLGGGWSGGLGKMSFRGEGSVFIPAFEGSANSVTSVSATISTDYTFENSLYVGAAFLFNSMGSTAAMNGISLLSPDLNLSAKQLSLGKYELFGQVSYPLSPIVNVAFATMYNPSDHSAYLGPTATISLLDDLELMLTAQLMLGDTGTEYGAYGNTYACYGRLRWSF